MNPVQPSIPNYPLQFCVFRVFRRSFNGGIWDELDSGAPISRSASSAFTSPEPVGRAALRFRERILPTENLHFEPRPLAAVPVVGQAFRWLYWGCCKFPKQLDRRDACPTTLPGSIFQTVLLQAEKMGPSLRNPWFALSFFGGQRHDAGSTLNTMSRLKNFSRNLATSYLQLGVNVVYSLVSIPLILHWLPKAEFGMWAMLVQWMGYIALIDLGMNSALARFLVDYKDRRGSGKYGALFKTSILVSLSQGFIIASVVTLGAPLLAKLMDIQTTYQATFINLIRIQGMIVAFKFCMNPLTILLYAHQRMDISSYKEIFSLVAGLGLLLFFLFAGHGIYSFIFANAITALLGPSYLLWACWRLALLPRGAEWGETSWRIFNEVFIYGRDVFLMGLGSQLVNASQTIVVSRVLGLESAAVWAVGTKMYNLVVLLLCRPYGAAIPGMSEMVARGETVRLQSRFKEIVVLTSSLGVFLGTAFALCNSAFVSVWTGGKIEWSSWNDALLGTWLFICSMQTTHCHFVSVTKQIGGMRYMYFLEGCCFVTSAVFVGHRWGIPGIIVCSIICTTFFTYQYGLHRTKDYFHLRWSEVAVEWIKPSLKLGLILVPVASLIWLSSTTLANWWRFCFDGLGIGIVGGIMLLRVGLYPSMLRQVAAKLPRHAARLLQAFCPLKIETDKQG
jgi:O-antigen/teichoic acid export membrane protein